MGKRRVVGGGGRTVYAVAAALAMVLAGCGGGGDGAALGLSVADGADSSDLRAMASNVVAGQAMPETVELNPTERALDLAIAGGGAFVLRDPSNGVRVLSRQGQLDIDAQGRLVNREGWLVEGAAIDLDPLTLAALAPLPPISHRSPPAATRRVALEVNLSSRADLLSVNFEAADGTTFNNATSLTVYDELGQSVALNFFFVKQAPRVWSIYIYADGEALLSGNDGAALPSAQITFVQDGSKTTLSGPLVIDIPFTQFGSGRVRAAIVGLELDLSGFTQFGAPFGPTNLTQDGRPSGILTSVEVKPTGEVWAHYSNGHSLSTHRLVLARTTVADRLNRYGSSGWVCGEGCRAPLVTLPGQLLTGMLVSGALNLGN